MTKQLINNFKLLNTFSIIKCKYIFQTFVLPSALSEESSGSSESDGISDEHESENYCTC